MRILGLHADGFGILHDVSVANIPAGLAVFLGDNEAGKTTCLSFVRDILFGFRDGRSKENAYVPLAGGQHGGRLTMISDRLGEVVIERRAGKKGGFVTVVYKDGRKGSDEELRQLLGGTTREVYKNIYAFSLSELQKIETLDDERVKGVLYGAATAMVSLPAALSSIEARLIELFRPGGSKPLINEKLNSLEDVRTRLREARKDIEKYEEACGLLEDTEKRISEVRGAATLGRREKERVEAFLRLWDDWLDLKNSEIRLGGLSLHIDVFPEQGLTRLATLLEAIERDEQSLRDLGTERETFCQDIEGLYVNQELLLQSQLMDDLLSRKEIYIQERSALPLAGQKNESKQAAIETLLGELGTEWTEEEILSVDRSLFAREAILKYQKTLDGLGRDRETLSGLVALKKKDYEEARLAEEEAYEDLDNYRDLEVEVDQQLVLQLQEGRDQFASVVEDLPGVIKELEEERKRIAGGIKEISPGWEEKDIRAFDCSIGARKKVQLIETGLAKTEKDHVLLQAEVQSTQKEQQAAEAESERNAQQVALLGPEPACGRDNIVKRKSAIRSLRNLVAEKEKIDVKANNEEARLGDKRQQKEEYYQPAPRSASAIRLSAFFIATIAVLTSVVFLFLERAYVASIFFVVGALAGVALFLAYRTAERRSAAVARNRELRLSIVDEEIVKIESTIVEAKRNSVVLNQAILDLLTSLSVESVKNEDIDAVETKTDEELSAFDRRTMFHAEQEKWRARAESAKKALDTLETKSREATSSEQSQKEAWNTYLQHIGLPTDIDPRTMDFVFGKIETVKGQLNEVRKLEERIAKMEDAKRRYLALAGKIAPIAEDTVMEPSEFLFSVDAFLRSTREGAAKRNERDKVLEIVEERKNRKTTVEKTFTEAQVAFEKAVREETDVYDDWRRWILERGFSAEISPPTALEAFTKMSECVRIIHEIVEIRLEIVRLTKSIDEYEKLAGSLFLSLGQVMPDVDKLAGRVDSHGKEHEQAKINATKKIEFERNLSATELKIGNLQRSLSERRSRLQELLETGEAADEEDFRVRGRLFEEKQQLLSIIAQKEANIKKISGEEDLLPLRQELGVLTVDQLKTAGDEWRAKLEDLDTELDSLRHEKAALEQNISALSSADDISRIRSEEEALLEETRNLSREWGRNALARALLAKTRRHFEQEQQPRVINDAGKFFRDISGGKYQRIAAPIGEDTVEIVTVNEERKRPEQLSRGTAEQVYLAIRFGYIKNYTANGETLPVIMDDVLVNFDPGRAARTTDAILSLAENHQVLYFTCHPETIAAL